jgi:8-oxo-dGTP diphosphatase
VNLSEYKFCPRCGGPLEERELKAGEPERLVCSGCSFVFYQGAKLVAGALFELDEGMVLIQRAVEPGYGKWTFPGGFVERGERAETAAEREALEEAGLDDRGRRDRRPILL